MKKKRTTLPKTMKTARRRRAARRNIFASRRAFGAAAPARMRPC
jgi:hypothetical protein